MKLVEYIWRDEWYRGSLVFLLSPDNGLPLRQSIILPPFWPDMMTDPTVISHHFDRETMIRYQQKYVYAGDLEVRESDVIDNPDVVERGLFACRILPRGYRIGMWGVLGSGRNDPLSKYQPERNIELHLNKPYGSFWFVFHYASFSGFMNNCDRNRRPNCRMQVNGIALGKNGRIEWERDLLFVTIRDIAAGEELIMDYRLCK